MILSKKNRVRVLFTHLNIRLDHSDFLSGRLRSEISHLGATQGDGVRANGPFPATRWNHSYNIPGTLLKHPGGM